MLDSLNFHLELSDRDLWLYKHTLSLAKLTIFFVSHSQDDLWGSVVSRHHIWGHHETSARGSSQTEVQDLQGAIRLYHYIAWFEILERKKKTCAIFKLLNIIFPIVEELLKPMWDWHESSLI